jgi:ribosomal protein S18 acetylase RimI-like enzyme
MATVRPATEDDFEPVFELLLVRSRRIGDGALDRKWIHRAWKLADNWVAADRGVIVGYASLDSSQEVMHLAADASVGDALLAATEARARERGFDKLRITAVRADEPLWSLVERHAFTLEREILRMWRRVDGDGPPPEIDGITVRTYRNEDGPRVHALLDDAYAEWDKEYVRRSHDDWLVWMTDHDDFDPRLWFLAERGGALVGCALHWNEHSGYGWVKDIVVRSELRGRGLGKALLQHGFHAYAQRGATSRVGLKVDAANPTGAPQLYERVGFATDRRYGIWAKPL